MNIFIQILIFQFILTMIVSGLYWCELKTSARLRASLEAEIMRPLKLEDCYLDPSVNGKLGKYVISGYALIDLERFQEILMDREEYELAEFIQPMVDSAKIKSL